MAMPQNDTEASFDGQLELKKRARRRLVGAAALALLAAIVLPMVMEREPRQPVQEVQIKIPSQDAGAGVAARILPKRPDTTPLPPIEPDAKADVKPEAKPDPQAESKREPQVETKPNTQPDAKPKVVDKPAAKSTDGSAEIVATTKAEEARALAALSGNTAATDSDQWVVQLGAYREEGRVKLLMAKIRELRLPVYTETVDTPQGVRTRVRAGPFKSRAAAENARQRIGKIGVDGPVTRK
jgi:DedD protein